MCTCARVHECVAFAQLSLSVPILSCALVREEFNWYWTTDAANYQLGATVADLLADNSQLLYTSASKVAQAP